jgi:endonuclease/exonuclease/phosphatase family metal-dependent hydrolase
MSAPLKLVSLNIQRDKHLDLVLEFFNNVKPDVVTLQEVFENDMVRLQEAMGAHAQVFAPMTRHVQYDSRVMGVAILSRLPLRSHGIRVYGGEPHQLPELDQKNPKTWNNKNFCIAYADVEKENDIFRIGTTHLTWTPDGKPTDLQRTHTAAMLAALDGLEEFILTGDFNAPRGGEIWQQLATRYRDNVPANVTSTLDPHLHRVKGLEFVVDGIFSTPGYTVSGVEIVSGVSDHCALVATVSKRIDK